jgi:hypothetical protein
LRKEIEALKDEIMAEAEDDVVESELGGEFSRGEEISD